MSDPVWLQATAAAQHFFTAAGIAVGGVWTYLHFIRRRENETALQIDLAAVTEPYDGDKWLTFVDVRLTNKGRVALFATGKQLPAYDDRKGVDRIGQKLDYGVDLQLWQVPAGYPAGEWINWADRVPRETPTGVYKEIDLATGYYKIPDDGEQGAAGKVTDFWMEPGESYSFGVPLVLGKGSYLAKVTFIGAAGVDEFWQRLFLVRVPTPAPKAAEFAAGTERPAVAAG